MSVNVKSEGISLLSERYPPRSVTASAAAPSLRKARYTEVMMIAVLQTISAIATCGFDVKNCQSMLGILYLQGRQHPQQETGVRS